MSFNGHIAPNNGVTPSSFVSTANGSFLIPGAGVVSDVVSSGTIYNVSAAESAVVIEAETDTLTMSAATAESASAIESTDGSLPLSPGITETAAITEAVTDVITMPMDGSESATITEGSVVGSLISVADAETVTITESATGVTSMPVAAAESVTVTESANTAYNMAVVEVIPAGDPYWLNNTVLTLHFDGADGDTTTTDTSAATNSISWSGSSSSISTAQSVFGGSSWLSTSTFGSDYVYAANSSGEFDFGSGEFTVETRFQTTDNTTFQAIIGIGGSVRTDAVWYLRYTGSLVFTFFDTPGSSTSHTVSATWSPSNNTWYALAVDRDSSGVIRIYVDGVMIASGTFTNTFRTSAGGQPLQVGSVNGLQGVRGYLDEVRITKGKGRYASDSGYVLATAEFPDQGTQAGDSAVGGLTLSFDDAETATATESVSAAFTVSAAETTPLTDAATGIFASAESVTENTATTDQSVGSGVLIGVAVDSVTADESEAGGLMLNGAAAEAQTPAESSQAGLVLAAPQPEAATITDSSIGGLVSAVAETESAPVTETSAGVSGNIFVVWEDLLISGDQEVSSYAGGMTAAEAASVDDIVAGGTVSQEVAAESMPAIAAQIGGLGRLGSILEIASPTDVSQTFSLLAAARSEAVSPLGDSQIIYYLGGVNAAEVAAVTEQISTQLNALAFLNESAIVSAIQATPDNSLLVGEASFLWARQADTTADWETEVTVSAGVTPMATVDSVIAAAATAEGDWGH